MIINISTRCNTYLSRRDTDRTTQQATSSSTIMLLIKSTHGDLQKKKMLVHLTTTTTPTTPAKGSNLSSSPNDTTAKLFPTSLVDWESADWYPSYCEYSVVIWTCDRMEDDFVVCLDSSVLDSYRVEYALCHELFEAALSPSGGTL